MSRTGKYLVAKCVWGAEYVDTMLNLNIPSLLAIGNLPKATGLVPIEHVLYTTAEDARVIEQHKYYRKLAALVPTRIILVEEMVEGVSSYASNIERMNAIHNDILRLCRDEGAYWIFDQPDHVWGDGSISWLVEQCQSGEEHQPVASIVFPAIRTILEDVSKELEPLIDRNGQLTISNRSLLDVAFRNMHVHDRSRMWGREEGTVWPHHVSWRTDAGAMLRRSFYLQPFVIAPLKKDIEVQRSVDADFLEQCFERVEDMHAATDTDDFFVLEVSPRFHVDQANNRKINVPLISAWASQNATPWQRRAFSIPFRFHTRDVNERRWQRIEQFTDRIVHAVIEAGRVYELAETVREEHPELARLLREAVRSSKAFRAVPMFSSIRRIRVPDRSVITGILKDEIDWSMLIRNYVELERLSTAFLSRQMKQASLPEEPIELVFC